MTSSNETSRSQAARGSAVRLDGLWKSYGDTTVVRDVSLEAEAGEFITLLGPSGSGKTSTLMMVAGFVIPSRGEIVVDGRPIVHLPPNARNLGMVFQHYALFPHMTVAGNVAFPLEMRGVGKAEVAARVRRALAMVRLEGFESRYPRQLSGGQQQRVALARAIVFEPQVLLMDEPLGALDKHLREHMQLEIKRLHRDLGVTIFYVTHDQEEALTMSDRIVVMHDGAIAQVGTPRDLYERPANAFIATFIGSSNLLRGKVRGIEADLAVIEHGSGQIFRIQRPERCAAGEVTTISIRPEALRLAATPAVPAAENSLQGRVQEILYVGSVTRFRVAVGDDLITVSQQNGQDLPQPDAGAEVTLSWNPRGTAVVGEQDAARLAS